MVIDTTKLEQHAAKVLDARLDSAVEPSIGQFEQTLAGFERQVAVLGLSAPSPLPRRSSGSLPRRMRCWPVSGELSVV